MMSCITLELSALQISCHLPKSQKEPIQYWNPVVTLCFFSVCYMGVNPQEALSQEPWNKGWLASGYGTLFLLHCQPWA